MKKLKSLKTFSGACWQHTYTQQKELGLVKGIAETAVPGALFDLLVGHLLLILSDPPWVNFCPGTSLFMLKMQNRAVAEMARDANDFQRSEFQCLYLHISFCPVWS